MSLLTPQWPTPKSVHSLVSTRLGGVSSKPFDSLNLGEHVGDKTEDVLTNRMIFTKALPANPLWLKQTHSTTVSTPRSRDLLGINEIHADASVSNNANEVLIIMTADCLPVLFVNTKGTVVGAAHAGWRGLCSGILENTVAEMIKLDESTKSADILVYLGPAIGPDSFEVGEDVKTCFQESGLPLATDAFRPIPKKTGKYLANLYQLARGRLNALGINQIFGGECCTVKDQEQFFSYRRDGQTGRFASAIWISK
jgi:YfiH family protein